MADTSKWHKPTDCPTGRTCDNCRHIFRTIAGIKRILGEGKKRQVVLRLDTWRRGGQRTLAMSALPAEIQSAIKEGDRILVWINLNAERAKDLVFLGWELCTITQEEVDEMWREAHEDMLARMRRAQS